VIYKVFYTDRFIPERFGGNVYGCLILIRPRWKGNKGLLEHEKTHVRQWWRSCGIGYWLLYHLSKTWRLKYEVEGYQVQLIYSPQNLELFGEYLATKYGLDLTQEEAVELIIGD